jgi:hypothetical protein
VGVRSRTVPLAVTVVVLLTGLGVHALAVPGADKLGDGLYAALVVALVWLLRPSAPGWVLAGMGLAWCWGVELLQPLDLLDPHAVGVAVTVTAVVAARR